MRPVFARIVHVEMHLPGVGVRQRVELQVDDHEASKGPIEKEEVDPVPRVADAKAALAADESERSPALFRDSDVRSLN